MFNQYKKIIIIVLAMLLIAILGYKFFAKNSAHPPQMTKVVESTKLTPQNISQTISLIGTVKAKHFTTIIAKSSGTLKIIANSGDKLEKNSLIAKIENPEIEKNYELSISAEKLAQEQFNRGLSLLKSGSSSKQEFENSKNNLIKAQKDLANAKIEFEKSQFYAPFDGIVGHYKEQNEAQLRDGDEIVSFYNPSEIKVYFSIPANILSDIQTGQNLIIAGKNYQLANVHKMLDPETHMSPAAVDIECDNCIIGSNITVELTVKQETETIVIPFTAIFMNNGKTSVYIIVNDKAIPKEVELGIRNKNLTEVLSGLNAGDELIIQSPERLYPGINVKVAS